MHKYNQIICGLNSKYCQSLLNTERTEATYCIHGSGVRILSMYSKLIYKLIEIPVKVTAEFLLL